MYTKSIGESNFYKDKDNCAINNQIIPYLVYTDNNINVILVQLYTNKNSHCL